MNLLRNQHMSANIDSDPQPRDGPVEEYARLAELLTRRPDLAGTLLDVGEKLATAQEMRWTGTIQIDLTTGTIRGDPTLKAR